MTTRHDKATEGRTCPKHPHGYYSGCPTCTDLTEAAAVDQAIAWMRAKGWVHGRVLADAVEELRGAAEFAGMPAWQRLWAQKEAAEAENVRLAAVESAYASTIRDLWGILAPGRTYDDLNGDSLLDVARRLARQVADLEAALRKIADAEIDDRNDDLIHGSSLRKLARAALAARSGDPQAQAKPDQADLRSGQEGA